MPPPGVRAMASGGIVTEPTLALIGEAGPEAVVPLPDYQPPGVQDLTSPEVRAQVLRNAGWTDAAIQQALGAQTTISQSPPNATEMGLTRGPNLFGRFAVPWGNPDITLYQPNIEQTQSSGGGAWPESTLGVYTNPSDVYEHEAHHAMDMMNPQVGEGNLYNHGQDAATVVNDLNTLRQYAAVQHNSVLYDAANDAMAATANDPEHINHYLAYASGLEGAPDWYLAKYFPYMRNTPTWSGAQAQSAPLTLDSSRLQGA